MKVHGDIESVNLAAGERFRRVSGDGESRLVPVIHIKADKNLSPKTARAIYKMCRAAYEQMTGETLA